MSYSRYKAYQTCPAAAWAKYHTDWKEGPKECFAIGQYVDLALLTPEIPLVPESFQPDNVPFLFDQKGQLRNTAGLRKVQACIAAAQSNEIIRNALLNTERQAVLYPTIGGAVWKCALDVWDTVQERVWDLKTSGNPYKKTWSPKHSERVSYITAFGYGYQLAVYREAVRQAVDRTPRAGIIAVGLTDPPDIRLHPWSNPYQLDAYLAEIEHNMTESWYAPFECVTWPPIMDMATRTTVEGLPRCEEWEEKPCQYCLETRTQFVFPHCDPDPR